MIKTEYITSDGQRFEKYELAETHESKLDSGPRTLVFYGSSDDCRIVEATSGKLRSFEPDEFYTDVLILRDKDGRGVRVVYTYNGYWSIGLAPLEEPDTFEEYQPLPVWINHETVSWSVYNYSMCLTLKVPGDVVIEEENKNE